MSNVNYCFGRLSQLLKHRSITRARKRIWSVAWPSWNILGSRLPKARIAGGVSMEISTRKSICERTSAAPPPYMASMPLILSCRRMLLLFIHSLIVPLVEYGHHLGGRGGYQFRWFRSQVQIYQHLMLWPDLW